jgi:Zn-dependent protease with chaperone function
MIPIPSVGGAWGVRAAVTVIAAALPAAFAWWSDRRLLGKADDPALPELLASRRRASIRVMAIGVALIVVFGGGDAEWGIPLLIALLIAAAYPLRRRLLGETWAFGAYLWYTALSVAGSFGFWILLAYAPGIVDSALAALGVARWPVAALVAAVLAAVLFALEEWYPRIWLWTHAARPLEDPVLTPRFDEIVRRAGTVTPRVYHVGPQGSRFMNAVALPSVRRPSVAMGTALLELLEPDESTAIFAHEIAHFDHFTPRRIRRSQLINRLLIALGVSLPLVTTLAVGNGMRWIAWVWPVAVLFALARRAAKSQQHETESDLRAAALCGDPEALVRGLVTLHLHARIPRRYAVDVERAATHPSLVRRIQAIRAGGAAAVEQLGAATVVRSPRPGSWVVLDAGRSYWLDGVPDGVAGELAALRDAASSYRAVNYGDLVELHVAAAGDSRTLTARVRGGDAWRVPIAHEDVARVQRTLDIVDLRLGKAGPAPSPALSAVIALATLLAALLAGQMGILLVPIAIALWKPSAAAFAALGATSIVRAALGALEGSRWFDENVVRLGLVALAALGVGAIYTAWRLARAGDGQRQWRLTMTTLGAVAAVLAVAVVWQSLQVSFASLAGASMLGALGTALIGIAATLFLTPMRWRRAGAYAGLVAGATLATVGVDRRALSLRDALAETTARATPVAQMDLGGAAYGLRVSPNGSRFLAMRPPMTRRPAAQQTAALVVGRFDGPVREVSAIGGDFVDDERILVLAALDGGVELRLERVDGDSGAIWADTLAGADYVDMRLVVDRDSGSWAIVGEDTDNDGTSVVAGRIGEKGSTRRAGIPDTLAMIGEPMVFGEAATVIVPVYANVRRGRPSSLWAIPLTGMDPLRTELWRVRGDSLTRGATLRGVPECGEPAGGVVACSAQHFRSTSLYTIDANGTAVEVAQLRSQDVGAIAVGPGARAASMKFDRSIQVIDLAARRLTTISLPPTTVYATEVRAGPGYVATLSQAENRRSMVRLYRIH